MKKIIGIIICTLLITTSGFSVVGINDKENSSYEENALSFLNNPKSSNQIDEWPMFRHDLNNTGYSTSPAPDDSNVLWSKYIGHWVESNPTVKDERLYIVGNNYNYEGGADLWCLNPFDGSVIWKTDIPDEFVWGSPTVANDRVYALGTYFNLYCYDAYNGDLLWNFESNGHCSPMVVEDKLYFGCNAGDYKGFYCLNATTGEEIWFNNPYNHPFSGITPAIVNGKLYVGDGWYLYCLNAETGAEFWESQDKCDWGSPAFYENKIYIGRDKFYCLNADTGGVVWSKELEVSMTHCSPAIAYGNVYIDGGYIYPDGDGRVYCYDADDGDWIWTSPLLANSIWNGFAVADGKLYTCSNNLAGEHGKFNCLDAFTGELLWDYTFVASHIYSSPAVAYGNVYVGSGEDGFIYAFGPPNEPPETPTKPEGPDNGLLDVEYLFNSSSTDPEDDDIYYLFDWGDGNDSGWIGPYASGEKVSASHIWIDFGYYDIRVKAYDNRQDSNWSEPLTIHIATLPPDAPIIDGPSSGKKGVSYDFTFNSVDPEGDDIYYFIKWGDGASEDWAGPYQSGEDFIVAHSYPFKKTFTIEAKAKDGSGAESDWSEFEVNIPRTRTISSYHWFLERFPMLERLLNLLN